VRWPARLEVLGEHPYVVADGAHTPESAALVAHAVKRHLPYNRLILVFGAMADKDAGGMLDALLPHASQVLVARSLYPRSLSAAQLERLIRDRNGPLVATLDDVADAFDMALSLAAPDDLVLVTGSLFVAAAARERWARAKGLPLPEMDPPAP
jgi:dihydrofolate synthase/folylpolyglutamate synthase